MQVFGVSLDTPARNADFAKKGGYAFPLLSDESGETARAYGVLMASLKMASRQTFYIDPEGKVRFINRKVNPGQAGTELLQTLLELKVPKR